MKKLFLMAMMASAVVACKETKKEKKENPTAETTAVEANKGEKSLNWVGEYAGTLPCASCEGINVNLVLNEDKTYQQRLEYVGEKDNVKEDKGTFTWIDSSHIKVDEFVFEVSENKLVLLGEGEKKNEGELADDYILHKK